ncbi:MAG: sigma 54-interacting transcriptional regulator [bacterium]
MPQLIFYRNGEALLSFPLHSSTTQIGRGAECDVTLSGEMVSRLQLTVYQSEGAYLIKNVGKLSAQINGAPFESSPLKEGDRVKFGDWELEFRKSSPEDGGMDDTYVSKIGGEGTQALHASFASGKIRAEQVRLLVCEPENAPRVFEVRQEVTTIGKSPACDLKLNDSFCSDSHAKFLLKNNRMILFDLHSTNGSFVNGVKVREAEVEEGSKIRLGKTEIEVGTVAQEKELKPLSQNAFGPFVGGSPAMRQLYALIEQVAPVSATVCVFGETGSGKELVARSLHDLSPRHLKPFVALNCGAISRELIESELFGHEKGAFTGAHQQRKGAFEQASGGTLFLDEIGELPLDLQPNLLRVLETGKLKRVGGNAEIAVDVRVVCATHRDLSRLVSEGKFREDLFFRLYVFPLYLPPLRDRREDIPLIAEHFLKTMTPAQKKLRFSSAALRFLQEQEWRGNVRELKNAVQRAVVLAKGEEVAVEDLSFPRLGASVSPTGAEGGFPSTSNLQDLEKQIILRELKTQDGNRLATAKALGIAKSTLYEKLKLYGIS